MYEGQEVQDFWDALGGQTAYASGKILEEQTPSYPPRLFQCSNASGRFTVEEIFDYSQEVSHYTSGGIQHVTIFNYIVVYM